MDWHGFTHGFWHPFGPYVGLTAPQILDWKRREVQHHGWTLWSFAYSKTAGLWVEALAGINSPVHVLCSYSRGAMDPGPEHRDTLATYYRALGEETWHKMPDPNSMKVTNPMKNRRMALAFKVIEVHELSQ